MKIEVWNRDGKYMMSDTTPDKYLESLNNLEFNASIDLHAAPKGVKKAVYAAEYYNHVVSPDDEAGSDPRMIHLYSPALLLTEDEFASKFSDPKTRVYSVQR